MSVPITREFLREFYRNRPAFQLDPEVEHRTQTIQGLYAELCSLSHQTTESLCASPPRKLDELAFRMREQFELIEWTCSPAALASLTAPAGPWQDALSAIATDARRAHDVVLQFQNRNRARIEAFANQFIPKDGIRASFVRSRREKKEAKYAAQLDELLRRNGTIRERYNLLWAQQMERRQQLVDFGNASGIYKMILKTIGGVPQSLLDFVKQLNSDTGPIEEIRLKYGPPVYSCFVLANAVFVALTLGLAGARSGVVPSSGPCSLNELSQSLHAAMTLLVQQLGGVYEHLFAMYEAAPFFITADQANAACVAQNRDCDFLERNVEAGKQFVVPVAVEAGSRALLVWEFTTRKHDIGFGVEFVDRATLTPTTIIPLARVRADTSTMAGEYLIENRTGEFRLTFDNGYSTWTSKDLRFKVVLIPDDPEAESS